MMIMMSIMMYSVLLNFQIPPNDAVNHNARVLFLKNSAVARN